MIKLRQSLFAVLCLLGSFGLMAQTYTITDGLPSSGYNDISGVTGAFIGNADDGEYAGVVPFDLMIGGTNYSAGDALTYSDNGIVVFDALTFITLTNANLPAATFTEAFLAVLWDDLDGTGGPDATTGIYSTVTGTAPNRIWTVQWHKTAYFSNNATAVPIDAQFQFEEGSNTVTYYYLNLDTGGNADDDAVGATIGLQGAGGAAAESALYSFNSAVDGFQGVRFLAGECVSDLTCSDISVDIDGNGDGTVLVNIDDIVGGSTICIGDQLDFGNGFSGVFMCGDNGDNDVTVVLTPADATAAPQTCDVTVTVNADFVNGACAEILEVNLACIGEINLTLNENCQGLVIPSMVLTGDFDADGDSDDDDDDDDDPDFGIATPDLFDIVVMDDDPSNGPIVDGCGSFNFRVTTPDLGVNAPVEGFQGIFAPENFIIDAFSTATFIDPDPSIYDVNFINDQLIITTRAREDNGGRYVVDVRTTIGVEGTLSFNALYQTGEPATGNPDTGFDVAIVATTFEGDLVDIVGFTDPGESQNAVFNVLPGYVLIVQNNNNGLNPEDTAGGQGQEPSTIIISNFVFDEIDVAVGVTGFETCWGIVNAEDKTPPAVTALPTAPALFCTELDDVEIATLDNNISRCYTVTSSGAFVEYRANFQSQRINNLNRFLTQTELGRRLVRGGGLPTATDGCSETLEICVNDVIQRDPIDPACNDVLVTRRFTVTETGSCMSAAGESNGSTVDDYVLTFVRPTLDDLDGDAIEPVANIECDDFTGVFGVAPAPRVQDFPFLNVGGRIFPLSDGNDGETICNIGVTFEDGQPIITCPNTFKVVRTFTVIDWCEPGDVRTFTQVVKVGDTEAPTFSGPRQFDFQGNELDGLTFSTNAGNICAAYIRLDDPTIRVADNCSENIFITANIYPNGDLEATPIGTFVVDLNDGNAEISSAIPVGDHVLRYLVRDDCGNLAEFDFDFSVVDRTAPVAVCEDGLNISITAGQSQTDEASTGIAVITPEMIDAGSYDDCNGIDLFIARVNDANVNIEPYDQELVLTCADLGVVRVGLRVIDDLGNVNDCWLDILVEDKARPTCFQPAPVRISCIEFNETLPADIQEATDEELDAAFGAAFGLDNCEVNIEQTIIGSLNSCGVGNFTRRFTVTDGQGFTNTNACVQSIIVYGVHDYTIEFPVDVEGDCMDIPEYDGIESTERACDLIAVNVAVDTFRSQNAADECFKLEVVYEIINWCEYEGEGQAYIIPRDGDGLVNRNVNTQPLYLHVVPGVRQDILTDDFAFLSRFSDTRFDPFAPQRDNLLDNGDDNDGDDDDNGNDNIDDDPYATDESRGFFRYTQFIKIYDDVAPVIDTDFDSEDCFAGIGENCVADVTIDFTAEDDCSAANVTVELDADYLVTAGFQRTRFVTNNEISRNGDGSFRVSLSGIPVGEHALRVRAGDGCGNFDVEIIEFCVTADKAPTPICIQTLTVTLMPNGNGGGMADIWASDFIASDVEDCFGNVIDKYSIYTEDEIANGTVPSFPRNGIILTCDDTPEADVRVYAFDDAGNSDYCSVVVEVQDNNDVCGDEGERLAGTIATQDDVLMSEVNVNLTGANDMNVMVETNDNGVFTFTGLPLGADYTIEPSYARAVDLRVVKTSDIIATMNHILGEEPLASAYEYVAADVNQDEDIDIFDIIGMRRVILGLDNAFANADGDSWVFVSADFDFGVDADGYLNTFPEVFNANNLQGSILSADFVAIELGNVARSGQGRNSLGLGVQDARLEAGQTHTIELNGTELAGFQGTLELAAGLELVGVDYDANAGAMNLNGAAEGRLAMSFSAGTTITVEVRATVAGLLSELVSVSDAVTVREAVSTNGATAGLSLNFAGLADVAGINSLGQNFPNPVTETTRISYTLAKAGDVTLSVRDVTGRTILVREMTGAAGQNVITLDATDLRAAKGVVSYTLVSGDFAATKQMIVVR